MRLRGRQTGLSIWGLLFGSFVFIVFAIVGFRVVPAYIEYFSVKSALEQAVRETSDFNSTTQLRNAFQHKADAGYIASVKGADIQIEKQDGQVVAHLDWTRKLHLVSNVYVVIEFETKAQR